MKFVNLNSMFRSKRGSDRKRTSFRQEDRERERDKDKDDTSESEGNFHADQKVCY